MRDVKSVPMSGDRFVRSNAAPKLLSDWLKVQCTIYKEDGTTVISSDGFCKPAAGDLKQDDKHSNP